MSNCLPAANVSRMQTSCPTRVCGLPKKCMPFTVQRNQASCPLKVRATSDGQSTQLCMNCGETLTFVAGDGIDLSLEGGALVIKPSL